MAKGFKFSVNEKEKFEAIAEVIEKNIDENSVVWGFPHVKAYNLLLDNYVFKTFVPILFYDTCANDYAVLEADMLKDNEPDIVVWADIPGCIELHENAYRNGQPLGQRAVVQWFSEAKDKDYELIAQVDNIFVYRLKTGESVSEKYIVNPNAVNQTASDDT